MENLKVQESIISQLKQNYLYIKEIVFKREKEIPENLSAGFDVDFKYEKDNIIHIELKGNVKSDNGTTLEVVVAGEYELVNYKDFSPDIAKSIMEQNSVAIMFPYLRAEITIVSSQPNMPSFNVPPINIVAFLEDVKKKGGKAE